MADIQILSAFGRGHWMAAELSRRGHQVLLVELSEIFGPWSPEDGLGPFGFFGTEMILPSQLESLQSYAQLVPEEKGFTVFGPRGPIEMKGPLIQHRLKALGLNEQGKTFDETWLWHLGRQLTATRFRLGALADRGPIGSPIGSSFYSLITDRSRINRSLDWLKREGVEVLQRARLTDISVDDKRVIRATEVDGLVRKIDYLVSFLNSSELEFASPLTYKLAYRNKTDPVLFWARYRLRIPQGAVANELPSTTVVVPLPDLPWTHSNLLCIVRTPTTELLDLWALLPFTQRFNKTYLSETGLDLLTSLNHIMPSLNAEIADRPQEYSYGSGDLGPPRFPVFTENTRPVSVGLKNFYVSSVEEWNHFGFSWIFQDSERILAEIQQSIDKQLKKLQKNKKDNELV